MRRMIDLHFSYHSTIPRSVFLLFKFIFINPKRLLEAMWSVIPLVLTTLAGVSAYLSLDTLTDKDRFLSDVLLRDFAERMGKELAAADVGYIDYQPERQMTLMARASKDFENEQLDYDTLLDGNPNPSIRDQEYLQHSSLWGHQYVTGGAGEGEQRLKPSGIFSNSKVVKTDGVLPAYCNPPNPCPVGYTEDQGCINDFENTAAFSRLYQEKQRCMCDGEHMFTCESRNETPRVPQYNLKLSSKLEEKFQNPFLTGERLPIAAKKGYDINLYDGLM